MFPRQRMIKGKQYLYQEHSFRIGDAVKKVSFYIPRHIHDFNVLNKRSLRNIVELRVNYIQETQQYSRFFRYGNQLQVIEENKIAFQVLFNLLPPAEKAAVLNEFLRIFLVNSMAMEGGTISYDIAKAIDERKKVRLENINRLDLPLYKQLKQAYSALTRLQLRYPKQLRDLHKIIYTGIYPFAGKFRTKKVTFGDLHELAATAEPEKILPAYQQALRRFYKDKGKVYDFERIIRFHVDIQQVHGFEDGNSRLGRLIMMHHFLQAGYPPLLIRRTQSRAYRRCLVRAINEDNLTSVLKFFYLAYTKTFTKFWLPILEEKVNQIRR